MSFAKDTQILLPTGAVKNIQDIQAGDKVISHTGDITTVQNIFSNEENVVNLSIRNNINVLTTEDTYFYNLFVPTKSKNKTKQFVKNKNKSSFVFTRIKELRELNILTCPKIKHTELSNISPDEAFLLGLFAAEGSYGKKYSNRQAIVFTYNINELETLAAKTKLLLEKTFKGVSVHISKKESVCIVSATGWINGIKLSDYFYSKVGEYSRDKTLSKDIVFGTQEVKEQFLIGWLEGDGHVCKRYGKIIGITVSNNMANQIRTMLHSLEIWNSLYKHTIREKIQINEKYPHYDCSPTYRIEIPSTAAIKLLSKSNYLKQKVEQKYSRRTIYYDNYFISSILMKKEDGGYQQTFDLKLGPENSFIANNVAVQGKAA